MPAPQVAPSDMSRPAASSRASRSACASRRLAAFGALALLCLALVPGTALASQDVALTDAASGTTISVAIGDGIVVTLEANASTGYHWVVAAAPAAAILQATPNSGEYTAPTSDLLGAPGTQTFRYRAMSDGTTKLVLNYVAPGTNEVGRTFEVAVEVEAATSADVLPATATGPNGRGSGADPLTILAALSVGAAACVLVVRIRASRLPDAS